MHGSKLTSHGASPLLRVLRVPWRSKRPGASLWPRDGLIVRMRPESAGMDLGGGDGERLLEKSRWAGSGWQSGLLACAGAQGDLAGMTRSAGRGIL